MNKSNEKVTSKNSGKLTITNIKNYFNAMNYLDREGHYNSKSDKNGSTVWIDKQGGRAVAKRYIDENGDTVYRVDSKILERVKNKQREKSMKQ